MWGRDGLEIGNWEIGGEKYNTFLFCSVICFVLFCLVGLFLIGEVGPIFHKERRDR